MSAGKIFSASLVAGLVLFVWGFIAHMFLGLGEVGIKEFPNDQAIVDALKTNLTEPGFYFFPGMGPEYKTLKGEEQKAAMKAWEEKYKMGPTGILVYNPTGSAPMHPGQLLIQFLTDFFSMFLAAVLLGGSFAHTPSYGKRLMLVTLLGVLAVVVVHVPSWNWYRFPGDHTLAAMVERVLGFFVAGLVLAAMLKPKAQTA